MAIAYTTEITSTDEWSQQTLVPVTSKASKLGFSRAVNVSSCPLLMPRLGSITMFPMQFTYEWVARSAERPG